MITFLSRLGERVLDVLTGRKIEFLLLEVQTLMTQTDEVRELVAQLGGDVASMRTSLAGVASDVTDLKAQIDALPAGEPIDPEVLADLRSKVADVADVTDQLAQLDESTPGSTPEEPTDPESPADPSV